MKNSALLLILASVSLTAVAFVSYVFLAPPLSPTPASKPQPVRAALPTSQPTPISISPSPATPPPLAPPPFIIQAPHAAWTNPLFQDGCEEASVLMVKQWLAGMTTSEQESAKEILALSAFEDKTYGPAPDRSVADTAQLIRDYLHHDTVHVQYDITAVDMIRAVERRRLIIVPIDGRVLKNPFYTPPGPERHMLVIYDYDAATDEFITNDPGTKRGAGYRYQSTRLVAAIRDYPTGTHVPRITERSAMIVVER